MSIQSEVTLLRKTKDGLRTAIMEKGVTVQHSDLFSTYPTRISQISMTSGDKDNLFKSLIDRSITSFTIPDGTTKIREFCFEGCNLLASVTIPNTVSTIQVAAFRGCTGLITVDIPDSVTETKESAFRDCTGLTSVTIGTGIQTIGNLSFYNCTGLTSITIMATIPPELIVPESINAKYPFDNTNNCPIYVPSESVQAYKTAWPQYASRIYAQASPYALFNSVVDGSVTDLTVPDGVRTIGYAAFGACTVLEAVTIPSTVKEIGSGAFFGCPSLVSVTCLALTPPTLGNSVFYGASANLVIYVPSSSVNSYKSASGWSDYASNIQAIQS